MQWAGRVILITGASSGIGERLALAFARDGAVVGLIARREELLRDLELKCGSIGGVARAFACNVADEASVNAAAASLRAEFGQIDILVANAGISGASQKFPAWHTATVRKVFDVNLMGAVIAVNAVLPDMLIRGAGQLVAVSSLAGSRGLPRSAAYSASKAAMNAYFESVRLDTIGNGIDVTIIQPGFIKTPLTADRAAKMPFLMELDDAMPYFLEAIAERKRFAAFPWQLAAIVGVGRVMPARLYDRIAGRALFRE